MLFVPYIQVLCFSWSTRWTPHAAQIYISKINSLRQYNWWRQNPKHTWHTRRILHPKVNTKPPVVSSYPQVFGLWPWLFNPTWLLMCEFARVQLRVCICTVCIRMLLDPGSIWLTQAVCIKGFWVCFGSALPPNRVQARVKRWKAPFSEGLIGKTAPPCCLSFLLF